MPGGEETPDHSTRHIAVVVLERCLKGRPENAVTFLPKSISAARPTGGNGNRDLIRVYPSNVEECHNSSRIAMQMYRPTLATQTSYVGRHRGIFHFTPGTDAESSSWSAALMLRSFRQPACESLIQIISSHNHRLVV